MSWLQRLAPVASSVLEGPPLLPQVEAWTDRSHLEEVAFHDITGVWPGAMDRQAAMRVPAVSRSRHLTCGTIAGLPVRVYRGDQLLEVQPSWAYVTDGQLGDASASDVRRLRLSYQSPWYRMLWTIDDHLFHGDSLWVVTRQGAPDESGRRHPLRMARVPRGRWGVTEDTGEILDADNQPIGLPYVYIPGPHEGLLNYGRDTIRTAADLERTAADIARRPFRLELHQTSGDQMTPAARKELVSEVRAALADHDGILFTNQAVETKDHQLNSAELLVPARNAAALDVARHVSMPAAMIDATTEGASLEYSTLNGRNQQWIDYGLSLYMEAVATRLGMDDVVPSGQRVAFDTTDLTDLDANPSGPVTED